MIPINTLSYANPRCVSCIFWRTAAAMLGVFSVVAFVMFTGPWLESEFFPVMKNFEVTEVVPLKNGVVFAGTVAKVRPCQYIHPWRARTIPSHRQLQVDIPQQDVPNWAVSPKIHFAPVTVSGVGTEDIELFSEHRCHPGWVTFSYLGTIKVSEIKR